MTAKMLAPETFIKLQIQLDRLHRSAEQCQSGLRRVRGGELTREAYCELLHQHLTVQREWEAKSRAVFDFCE